MNGAGANGKVLSQFGIGRARIVHQGVEDTAIKIIYLINLRHLFPH